MKRSKTKKVKNVNNETVIVAVDIGKEVHHGYMRVPNGQETRVFHFDNNRQGFTKFWNTICWFRREQGREGVIVGFESTGSYAEPLCHFLREKPVQLVQINPMHTKRLKELNGNSPNKTDEKDPRVIADIIELGHALTVVIPEGAAAELRSLSHARDRAIRERTAVNNQLQSLIFKLFPEFLSIMKDTLTKSALYLMENHPTPIDIIHIGHEALTVVLSKISRGRLGSDRAYELYEAARRSVGITQGTHSISMEITHLVGQIHAKDEFINALERDMERYLEQIPYSKNILSIRGIGTITVAGLIGEVGNFTKFATIKELEKLAGLDLYEISSGFHKGERHISKRGRSLMRKLLYCAALSTIRVDGIMHQQYLNMLGRGMPTVKAVVAISRRLLRVIYALVRDNTTFEVTHCTKTRFKKVS